MNTTQTVIVGQLGATPFPSVGPLRQATTFTSLPSNSGPVRVGDGPGGGVVLTPAGGSPGARTSVNIVVEHLAAWFVFGAPGDGVTFQTGEAMG